MNRRATLIAGGALVLAAGGLAATSFADTPSAPAAPQPPLALLRQDAAATSESLFATKVAQVLLRQRGDAVDAASARSRTVAGVTVWVAETQQGRICTASAVGAADAVAVNCVAVAQFERSGLFSSSATARQGDDELTTIGVVPDGTTAVRLRRGGAVTTLPVEGNVVVTTPGKRPTRITLVGAP